MERVSGPKALSDPAAFFETVRAVYGPLSQGQVEGIAFLLDKMTAARWGVGWTAYGLATAWHETAATMQPVREGLNASEEWRRRNLSYYPWYGRGYPQTTWEANYRKADDKLGLGGSLVADPDRMLEPEIAAATMIRGMEEGWFTGQSLGDYIPPDTAGAERQFKSARRIVNGTDRAALIAGHALSFQDALQKGGWK